MLGGPADDPFAELQVGIPRLAGFLPEDVAASEDQVGRRPGGVEAALNQPERAMSPGFDDEERPLDQISDPRDQLLETSHLLDRLGDIADQGLDRTDLGRRGPPPRPNAEDPCDGGPTQVVSLLIARRERPAARAEDDDKSLPV